VLFACVDIIGCDIAQSFVIMPVVIVFDEDPDRFLLKEEECGKDSC